jgi:hypothetical protein
MFVGGSSCKFLLFLIIFLCFFSFARAELDLTINSKLDSSNGFDTDFYLQTDPTASSGLDSLDFEQQGFPSGNYSFLTSTVSGKNLIVDAFPSETNRTAYLVYRVNPSTSGTLDLSWSPSVFGYHYDAVLTDYGSDNTYTTSVGSRNMKTSSSYFVSHSGATRYFSLEINYFNFSCGDGVCNGASRGEDCSSCSADCGVCPSSGENGGGGGGGETACVDSSWSVVSTGSCSYGKKSITQKSNCDNTRVIEEDCCTAGTIYGDWSVCSIAGTRTRNVEVISEDCNTVDTTETGSCTYQCSENWNCGWGSCQNGFITPINCVESNNCGTQDNKPQSVVCQEGENTTKILLSGVLSEEVSSLFIANNCSFNFVCEDWSACEVRVGMEDLKNSQTNLEGTKSRKCIDKNGCISVPYYEQQRCSLKVYITPQKETICGKEYLTIYERDTEYLLAKIKDDRKSGGKFAIQFVLGGRKDIDCAFNEIPEYTHTLFETIMEYTNARKLWRLFR